MTNLDVIEKDCLDDDLGKIKRWTVLFLTPDGQHSHCDFFDTEDQAINMINGTYEWLATRPKDRVVRCTSCQKSMGVAGSIKMIIPMPCED